MSDTDAPVRPAELVALLSLGTDLGLGQPMEHMIRACLIAPRLAERVGLEDAERGVVYYSGLLAWVGCHTDAYEQAKWLGDDLSVKSDAHYEFDFGKAGPATAFLLKHIGGAGSPLLQRARIGMRFMGDGRRALAALAENHYLATNKLAAGLGLGEQVRTSLKESYERWDGKGAYGLRGAQIGIGPRLVNLADVVEVFPTHRRHRGRDHRGTGTKRHAVRPDYRRAVLRARSADLRRSRRPSELGVGDRLRAVTGHGGRRPGVGRGARAIGEFAELKSPWLMGHSRGVAELATEAARGLGLPESDVTLFRRAAFVHEIGRLGVSNAVWDKPGELTQSELERVRLHPYLTERMLSISTALAPLGAIAGQHHERLDGSGYPRGLTGDAITHSGRILAAADVYHALTEARPHRPALAAAQAAAAMRTQVTSSRLDGAAVDAVLRAAGHRVRRRREWPTGLTAREVEIVRLLARGLTAKAATQLGIAPKTAGSHIEHIYVKTGASNRAQLSMFAMKHGLMSEQGQS